MHRLTGRIGEDLNLDVTRPRYRLLDKHSSVAKGADRFAHGGLQSRGEVVAQLHTSHAATAAACDRFRKDGKPDPVCLGNEICHVVAGIGRTEHGHAGSDGVLLCRDLVSGHLEHGCRWPNEGDAVRSGGLGKFGVFRKESVPRVNGVCARELCHANDFGYVKIGPNGVAFFANLVGLVSLLAMHRTAIFPGENRDGLRSQFKSRTKCPNGNFASVGHQDLLKHRTAFPSRHIDELFSRPPHLGSPMLVKVT